MAFPGNYYAGEISSNNNNPLEKHLAQLKSKLMNKQHEQEQYMREINNLNGEIKEIVQEIRYFEQAIFILKGADPDE